LHLEEVGRALFPYLRHFGIDSEMSGGILSR
jgi:hypothetical protein